MNIVVCPLIIFRRVLAALAEDPRREAFLRVGHRNSPRSREWLVRDILPSNPLTYNAQKEVLFRVSLSSEPFDSISPQSPLHQSRGLLAGQIHLGEGRQRSKVWGYVYSSGGSIEPIRQFHLAGSGMHRIRNYGRNEEDDGTHYGFDEEFRLLRSRTIGALGGEAIWRKIIGLRAGIVGCGRTGSMIAAALAKLGVANLTLIDPDAVEIHNLGESDLLVDSHLGRPKAEAIAEEVRRLRIASLPIAAPVAHQSAINALKECELIFCCADNDAARLVSAIISTLYHKILIDIGTGISYRNDPAAQSNAVGRIQAARTMGADIRLILPGDGCLLCRGNLNNYARAVEDICNHRTPEDLNRERGDWTRERAGSLHTLNQLAAATGVQMIQDLAASRIHSSVWARLEFDQTGRMSVDYPQFSSSASCPLCAKSGSGDEGLKWG